jgi:hypothetical protein
VGVIVGYTNLLSIGTEFFKTSINDVLEFFPCGIIVVYPPNIARGYIGTSLIFSYKQILVVFKILLDVLLGKFKPLMFCPCYKDGNFLFDGISNFFNQYFLMGGKI